VKQVLLEKHFFSYKANLFIHYRYKHHSKRKYSQFSSRPCYFNCHSLVGFRG